MKIAKASILALLAPAISARFIEEDEVSHVQLEGESTELFQIELSPGETRWVTEDQKWELRRVCRLQPYGVAQANYGRS